MNNDVIDLRGTRCPLTLLKMKQYLYQAQNQTIYTFVFDDPGAATDLPLYLARDKRWFVRIEQKQVESGQGVEYTAYCRRSNPKEKKVEMSQIKLDTIKGEPS